MTMQPSRYRLPVGIVTTQNELINLQKQLLRENYQNNIRKKQFSPHHQDINSREYPSRQYKPYSHRRSSSQTQLRYLQTPQSSQLPPISTRNLVSLPYNATPNPKDQQLRKALSQNLKQQIEETYQKKLISQRKKLLEQQESNRLNRQLSEIDQKRRVEEKQRVMNQMRKDYEEKLKRKEEIVKLEKKQKEDINARLKAIQAISSPQRRIKAPPNNPQILLSGQLNGATKTPEYYKDLSNYQVQNYKYYESNVKNSLDAQNNHYNQLIQQRIQQNKQRQQLFYQHQRQQRQQKRQQLQRMLQQQIAESQSRKKEQRAYDKAKFYGSAFNGIYNTIANPVDSKFNKDNKYIIGEITRQGQKRSRQSMDYRSRGSEEVQSSLARKGSQSLL